VLGAARRSVHGEAPLKAALLAHARLAAGGRGDARVRQAGRERELARASGAGGRKARASADREPILGAPLETGRGEGRRRKGKGVGVRKALSSPGLWNAQAGGLWLE